jgi:hypothetical protein
MRRHHTIASHQAMLWLLDRLIALRPSALVDEPAPEPITVTVRAAVSSASTTR